MEFDINELKTVLSQMSEDVEMETGYEDFQVYLDDDSYNHVSLGYFVGDFGFYCDIDIGVLRVTSQTLISCLEDIIDICDNWKNSVNYDNAQDIIYWDAMDEEADNEIQDHEYDSHYDVELTGDYETDKEICFENEELIEECEYETEEILNTIQDVLLPDVKEWLQKYIKNYF